jgi:Fe-S-cluster containining protein
VNKYEEILALADAHFDAVAAEQPQNLECGRGCSFCCHGLFEIGRGDVEVIGDGLRSMPAAKRARIIARAERISRETAHPDIREVSPEEKEAFFDRTDGIACPALSRTGECTMYAHRPIVCRTFGLPIREADEYIGDICELNFTSATQEEKERAAWDIVAEDPADPAEQYTIVEAVLIASRILNVKC